MKTEHSYDIEIGDFLQRNFEKELSSRLFDPKKTVK